MDELIMCFKYVLLPFCIGGKMKGSIGLTGNIFCPYIFLCK